MGSSSSRSEAGAGAGSGSGALRGGGSGGRAAGAAAAGREESHGAALGRAEEPATDFAEASLAENMSLAATILHSALAATTRLDLRSVALGDQGLEMLEGNLYAAGNLERLDLSETGLGDEGAERLARIIIENTRLCETLRDLRLAGNNIGVRGAKALSKLMCHKCDFETIDLSSNTSLSNDGAAGLFETAMISRPSQLRLAGCDLSDDVLDAIAKIIRSQHHPWTSDGAFARLYEKKTGGFRVPPRGSLHRKLEIDLTDNSFSAPKLNNLAQAVTALEKFCSIKVTLVENTDASVVLQPVAPREVQSLADVIRGLERQQITVEEPLSHRVPTWVSDPWASSVTDIFEQATTLSATQGNPLHICVVEVANDDGLTSRAFQVDKHLLRGDVLILFREEDQDLIRKNVLATRRRFSVEEILCHEPPERALRALLLRTNIAPPIIGADLTAFPPSFGAANDTPSPSTSKRLAETDPPSRSPKKKKN